MQIDGPETEQITFTSMVEGDVLGTLSQSCATARQGQWNAFNRPMILFFCFTVYTSPPCAVFYTTVARALGFEGTLQHVRKCVLTLCGWI